MASTTTLAQLKKATCGYATYPEVWLREAPDSRSSKIQHLIFGDYISQPRDTNGDFEKWTGTNTKDVAGETWVRARSRGEHGWIKVSDIELDRVLEVNFVDVGQGDGCHVVTPDDEHFIIDAGVSDNMFRFLKWRFNLANPGGRPPVFTAIISHPDKDHFYGFKNLFQMPENLPRKLVFDQIYHNGLVQGAGSSIGETVKANKLEYRTVVETQKQLEAQLEAAEKPSLYEQLLISAQANTHVKIEMLSKDSAKTKKNMPLSSKKGNLAMEVLGPITEKVAVNGKNRKVLRWFGNTGLTKNGHSIILKLTHGKLSLLLGGDLNSESADFLMEQYSGASIAQIRSKLKTATGTAADALQQQKRTAIDTCRKTFQSHIAKSCHHGSSDITNEFLDSVNPLATIISSGDEESFCHPRPETLGVLGKYSRGERPLLYSTELSRSSPEYIELKKDDYPGAKIKERIVVTYGMITLRSDGERVIIAQKLERKGAGKAFQLEKLTWNNKLNDFEYKGKN